MSMVAWLQARWQCSQDQDASRRQVMRVLCTAASGYIGGSIAVALVTAGHEVSGLVRSEWSAMQVRSLGITPAHGTLDDVDVLRAAAMRADVVINAASSDHERSALAMLQVLDGTGKTFIHTSGSSIVGTQSAGERVDDVFDEDTPLIPSSGRAAPSFLGHEGECRPTRRSPARPPAAASRGTDSER
ncbi:MAG: NAD(P)H-binding protein [Hyphomicrobiaceae bacterium]|nr:MAG: NAD(P)H-binding protein [Hyphomicrobiaceae bacterium]